MDNIILIAWAVTIFWALRLKKENLALRQIRDQIINAQKIYSPSFFPLTRESVTDKTE